MRYLYVLIGISPVLPSCLLDYCKYIIEARQCQAINWLYRRVYAVLERFIASRYLTANSESDASKSIMKRGKRSPGSLGCCLNPSPRLSFCPSDSAETA